MDWGQLDSTGSEQSAMTQWLIRRGIVKDVQSVVFVYIVLIVLAIGIIVWQFRSTSKNTRSEDMKSAAHAARLMNAGQR